MPPTNATRSSIDDRLLVVAVHRPFLRVERALDPRAGRKLVAHRPHARARRTEERQRGARPREHAHVDALRQLGEQIAEHDGLAVAHEREVGREVPAGQVDVRASRPQRLRDRRQRLRAVDEHLERIARRGGGSPAAQPPAGGSSARSQPILVEAPPVMAQICFVTCSPNQRFDREERPTDRAVSGAMRVAQILR